MGGSIDPFSGPSSGSASSFPGDVDSEAPQKLLSPDQILKDTLSEYASLLQFLNIEAVPGGKEYQGTSNGPILTAPNSNPGQFSPMDPVHRAGVTQDFYNQLYDKLKAQGLSEKEILAAIAEIMEALLSGKPVSGKYENLVKNVNKIIQERWGLPPTWSLDSKSAIDWTPIRDVAPPISLDKICIEIIGKSIEEILNALKKALSKARESIPPDSPDNDPINDVYSIMIDMLRQLKQVLRDLEKVDVLKGKDYFDNKIATVKAQGVENLKKVKKNADAATERAAGEKKLKLLRILAPVISGVIMFISIAACYATFGTSLFVGAAVATAVSGAMLAYSVVDSQTDCTSKALKAFNDALDKAFPGDNNLLAKDLLKAAIVALLVVIVALLVTFSGGGAAASIAAQTAGQIAKQVTIETVRQVVIQMIMTAILSSGFIADIVVDLIVALKLVDKKDEAALMLVKTIVMAVQILIMVVAMSRATGSAASKVVDQADDAVKDSTTIANEAAKNITDAVKIEQRTAMQKISAFLKNIGPSTEDSTTTNCEKIKMWLQTLNLTVEAATNVQVGISGLHVASIMRELGDIEKEIEVIKVLVEFLTKLVDSFQQGKDGTAEFLKGAEDLLKDVFRNWQEVSAKARAANAA